MSEFSPIDMLVGSYLIIDCQLGEEDPHRVFKGEVYHEATLAQEAYEQISQSPEIWDLGHLPIDTQRHLANARDIMFEQSETELNWISFPFEDNQFEYLDTPADESADLKLSEPSGEWMQQSSDRNSRPRNNRPIPRQGPSTVITGSFKPKQPRTDDPGPGWEESPFGGVVRVPKESWVQD